MPWLASCAHHRAHDGARDAGEGEVVDLHDAFGGVLIHHGGERVIGRAADLNQRIPGRRVLLRLGEGFHRVLIGEIERDGCGRSGEVAGIGAIGIGDLIPVGAHPVHHRGADPAATADHQDPARHGSRPSTTQTFCPPKPKELEIA